jgi:hypothetical protein
MNKDKPNDKKLSIEKIQSLKNDRFKVMQKDEVVKK